MSSLYFQGKNYLFDNEINVFVMENDSNEVTDLGLAATDSSYFMFSFNYSDETALKMSIRLYFSADMVILIFSALMALQVFLPFMKIFFIFGKINFFL